MGKRGSQAVTKAASKKPKVEPALALVMDTVKKASHLPDPCSAMLAAMLPFSLGLASDERADCQQRVVSMVEETLNTMKTEMQTSISTDEAKLEGMKTKMADLLGAVQQAEATLGSKKEALATAQTSLTEATSTSNSSLEALSEKQAAHSKCEANLISIQNNKSALENAFEVHFKTPMEAGQGPSFKELKPFVETMDLDKSMLQTLPGACGKSKDDRGSFDQVILEQLEKAITGKISSLGETVTTETSAVAQCASAVTEAETESNSKKEVQNQATAVFEAAQKDKNDADEALRLANAAVETFRPELEETTSLNQIAQSKLQGFENGPLANFLMYQTKTAPVEVTASAGA